jgi:hypothetical protein
MESILSTFTVAQIINFFLYIGCIAYGRVWIKRNRIRWPYSVPVIVLGMHGILFYVFHYYGLNPNTENLWSSLLRMQGITTAMLLLYACEYRLPQKG